MSVAGVRIGGNLLIVCEADVGAVPKPGSKAHRDRLRARLIALGFPDPEIKQQIVDDLLRNCGKRPREAWRLADELSLDEAAARFNAAVNDPQAPMRKNRIWDYEKWPAAGTRPTIRVLKILAEVYGTQWVVLVDVQDLTKMPAEERDAYHGVAAALRRTTRAPILINQATPPPIREHDGHPRSSPPMSPADALIEQAAGESADLALWAATTNVDDDVLEHLDRNMRAIAHAYLYGQPFPLLLRTKRLRDQVVRLLRGRQHPRQTRELYLLGSRLCTLLAWISGDLGNYSAAADHAWAGWMCAEHADHDGARTWVRATQAKLAFWSGDFRESARLAQDGHVYQPSDSAGLLLALLEARAWARVGRVDDARQALSRWEELDQAIGDDVGGVLGLSQAQQHYLAGSTHLWLHEPHAATTQSELAINLFEGTPIEERFYGAEMLARIDLAAARLQGGDLDGVDAALQPVLCVEPEQRLETFVQHLASVRSDLAGPDFRAVPLAQRLQDQIEDYTADAIGKNT